MWLRGAAECSGLIEVNHRAPEIAHGTLGLAAAIIGRCQVCIQLDSPVKISDRLIWLALL